MPEQATNPITDHPHLEHYPGAVQDVEKAHAMANAADHWETESAKYLRVAQAMVDQNLVDDESNMPLSHIKTEGNEKLAEAVNFVRMELEAADKGEWTNIEELASEAEYVQQFAENKYSAASKAYDALEAAKKRQVEISGEQDNVHTVYLNNVSSSAVTNIEKAHTMAMAADTEETNAAGLRYAANEALTAGVDPGEFKSAIMDVDMPNRYKDVMARTGLDDNSADRSVDGIVHAIKEQKAQADRVYEFTSEAYDKLKATER